MKPIKGRLQTAEHILSKIIEMQIRDANVVIAKFTEELGLLEIRTTSDLRKKIFLKEIQEQVQKVIAQGLSVQTYIKRRDEARKEIQLLRMPNSIQDVRIVEIENFDIRACKDPHVKNTLEVGEFEIQKLERVGHNRYRFTFKVK